MKKEHWIKLFIFKYSIHDIIDYFRANIRYRLYYSKFKWLIPIHIQEQIDFRINVMMDKECYTTGSCKVCGCTTTNLQMANKACEDNCYPTLISYFRWNSFKKRGTIIEQEYIWKNTIYIINPSDPKIKNYIKKVKYVG